MATRKDDLTPAEQARLAELLKITTHGIALEILALARGECPDLWLDGKPEPWPPARPPAQESKP